MDLTNANDFDLRGLDRKNIILGKNGCGKSRLLKQLDDFLHSQPTSGTVKYLSPERGGVLSYVPDVEQSLTSNTNWLASTRRQNQAHQFRQQSTAQFRKLELFVLREIEQNLITRANHSITFNKVVDRINSLLDGIYIKRDDLTFKIYNKKTNNQVDPGQISSGESELISLGIECLVFERECQLGKINYLLMDEPDVHLHPDLQARFANFIESLVTSDEIVLLIATHSTALLGAMSEDDHTRLAFMKVGDKTISFSKPSDAHKKVLPVFGAHPLSNVFNQAPVLLLEGEDDERIWQQAVRSSKGDLGVYPCSVDGISELADFELEVAKIIEAVYDDGVGYSLRDRDTNPAEIADIGPVRRMRLECRNAENLILADESLTILGISWQQLQERIATWLQNNTGHPHFVPMKAFAESGYNRKSADLKEIRNDLTGLMGSNKPWEVIVGQAIASLRQTKEDVSETSLISFIGPKACINLLGFDPVVPHT